MFLFLDDWSKENTALVINNCLASEDIPFHLLFIYRHLKEVVIIFIITNTMHTIVVDKITLFKTT